MEKHRSGKLLQIILAFYISSSAASVIKLTRRSVAIVYSELQPLKNLFAVFYTWNPVIVSLPMLNLLFVNFCGKL